MIVFSILLLLTIKAFNNNSLKSQVNPLISNDSDINNIGNNSSSVFSYNTSSISIDSLLFTRIVILVLFFSSIININFFYIESNGILTPSVKEIGIFNGLFYVSNLSIYIESLIYFIGGLILFSSYPPKNFSLGHKDKELLFDKSWINYSIIILFSILGTSLLLSSSDLISLYLSLELQSFGLYVLATLYKDYPQGESSTAAGLKYFLLGSLSSAIILFGSGLIYSYTGLTNLELIFSLMASLTNMENFSALNGHSSLLQLDPVLLGVNLGFMLIFIGLLFKISAAPLHNWSPDVYNDTPTVVTTWLTIIPKLPIIILLLDLFFNLTSLNSDNVSEIINYFNGFMFTFDSSSYQESLNLFTSKLNNLFVGALGKSNLTTEYLPFGITNEIFNDLYTIDSYLTGYTFKNLFKLLLLSSSFLSLIVGTVVGLSQNKIKRLLAYSTISHVGFILLALSVKSESSIDSMLFYITVYTITNLNIFLILICFGYYKMYSLGKKDINFIAELKGQIFENYFISLSFIISLFSLAGIPPLIGFFSKQYTLYAAIDSGYYFLTLLAIITSVISASYYLKIINILITSPSEETVKPAYLSNSLENSINSKLLINMFESNENRIESPNNLVLSNAVSYIISFFTLFILLYIIKPSLILSSTGVLSLYVFKIFS